MIDVDEKTGLAACAELQKEYSSKGVVFTRCDVTKPDELVNQRHGQNYVASNLFYIYLFSPQRSAFARTKDEFGGIDIIYNNAGILNEKQWRLMMDINLVIKLFHSRKTGVDHRILSHFIVCSN